MKKNSNKSIYGFLILLIFFSAAFSFQQIFMHLNSLNYTNSPILPLNSANEITLITPENKTYIGPMSGYYPATYGFENDANGTTGTNIDFIDTDNSGASCSAQIIAQEGNHSKVLELYDNNAAGDALIFHEFGSTQTSKMLEFWWKSSDASKAGQIVFMEDATVCIHIKLDNSQFQYYDGSWHNVKAASSDTWYHHTFIWDDSSNMFDWYIDDVLELDNGGYYIASTTGITKFFIETTSLHSGYYNYFDAFGFSWDSNYNVGDNLKEGLLLSYENSTNLDWIGFSLDGLANKTILGNSTIPLPPNGPHNIQVFGNDSLGSMYESDLRYFTADIGEIYIITPENKIYTEPMGGYFSATYGFEAYNSGEIPDSWNDLSGPGCSVGVVDEINNHKKVIQLNDNSGSGAIIETLFPNQKTGIVEWWWLSTDVDNWVNFVFYEGGTNAIHLEIGISAFRYYDTSYKTVVSSGVNNNQWYRNKVEFSVSTDKFNWYIYDNNGSLLNSVQDANFRNSVDDINHLTTGTNSAQLGYQTYIDAVSFSWDSNYNIGDNINEGLLLSYDTNTNLNWTGYSLDGNPNITIAGNKVIPFPEVGFHSIILNGITSNGALIKSDIRYFTIFIIIQDPPIPPNNPNLIPIILTIIGIGIIALLGITLFLFRRKISSRTSSTIISRRKSQSDENVASGSDQFKTCPLCHTQIKKTDQFCEYCGVSLKND